MKLLLRIADGLDQLIEEVGLLTRFIVILTILVGFANVILRYTGRFVGQSLTSNAFIEIQWYLFSLIFFLGFAYILKHNLNVRVDFLYTHWNPQRRAWVNLIGTLIFLIPFCLIGIYATLDPVLFSWGRSPSNPPEKLTHMWIFAGTLVATGLYGVFVRSWLKTSSLRMTLDIIAIVAFFGIFFFYAYTDQLIQIFGDKSTLGQMLLQIVGEKSPDANGLRRAPIKSMIIAAWVLLLLQITSQLIKYIAVIAGRQDYVYVVGQAEPST